MDNYTLWIKEQTEKKRIELISNRGFLYDTWEINSITAAINSIYYKNELLNTIESFLKDGGDAEDVFVFNKSKETRNQYQKLNQGYLNIKEKESLLKFYYIGNPIPMFPNEKNIKVYYRFEYCREFLIQCVKYKLNSPAKTDILSGLMLLDITNNQEVMVFLKNSLEKANESLIKEHQDTILKIDKVITSLKSISSAIIDSLKMEFNIKIAFEDEYRKLDSILKEIKEKDSQVLLNRFRNTFTKLERPIVCVNKSGIMYFFCFDLLAKKFAKSNSYRFFETNEIRQNSPLAIALTVGIGFSPVLLSVTRGLMKNVKKKQEALRKKGEEVNSDLELDEKIARYKKIESAELETNNEIESVTENNKKSSVSVKQEKIYEDIVYVRNFNVQKIEKVLLDNDIEISNVN